MKIKINWKSLGKQLWEAVKPVLLAAVAWISHTSQDANHSGSDSNGVTQANSTWFDTEVKK